jgi:hypothetical protein
MGFVEQFEQWLDTDLETLAHCTTEDRRTVEAIIARWVGQRARAGVVTTFFSNWQTALTRWGIATQDGAETRAQLALRLDDKYQCLRTRCTTLTGSAGGLSESLLKDRTFWKRIQTSAAPYAEASSS